jgi:hypothetical protein
VCHESNLRSNTLKSRSDSFFTMAGWPGVAVKANGMQLQCLINTLQWRSSFSFRDKGFSRQPQHQSF